MGGYQYHLVSKRVKTKMVTFGLNTIFYYKPQKDEKATRYRKTYIFMMRVLKEVNYLNLFTEEEEKPRPRFHRSLNALNLFICEYDCKCKQCV